MSAPLTFRPLAPPSRLVAVLWHGRVVAVVPAGTDAALPPRLSAVSAELVAPSLPLAIKPAA